MIIKSVSLEKSLREAIAKFIKLSIVDEKAIKELTKEIQKALISADVNVKLAVELAKKINERALKEEIKKGLTLREHVLNIVYEELTNLLGQSYVPEIKRKKILLIGLYGSGKTTSAAKIANYFTKRGLSVLLVGADVERAAAREQLKQLSALANAKFFSIENASSKEIVLKALEISKEDIIIVDSAGRSAFDDVLAKELKEIYEILKPDEVFLVLSADIGQVAGKQAEQFSKILPINGIILTKMDGSSKGGGALSAVSKANCKISFIGTGEKIDDLELYDAKNYVSRLLGMPDIKGLIEKFEKIKDEVKISEEDRIDLETFRMQLKAAKKLGPFGKVMSMFGASVPAEVIASGEEKIKKFEAILDSMTKEERRNPDLLKKNPSRIKRIALGSGCKEEDVKNLLNEFEKMKKMLEMFIKNRSFRARFEKMFGMRFT